MISERNIDLTLHRDFSTGLTDIDVTSIIMSETEELAQEANMSTQEFEKIWAVEQIFGKKRHYSIAGGLFHPPVPNDYEMRCCSCGKPIRFPWYIDRNRLNWCQNCRNGFHKLPWKDQVQQADRRNDPMEIFAMK